jgi:hypothetical protein
MKKYDILSAKKFNDLQDRRFSEYKKKCLENNVPHEPQNRYFEKLPIKYGFIFQNSFGEQIWKKTKKSLINYLNN